MFEDYFAYSKNAKIMSKLSVCVGVAIILSFVTKSFSSLASTELIYSLSLEDTIHHSMQDCRIRRAKVVLTILAMKLPSLRF